MQITLSGAISICLEGEWLFEGQPLPLTFVCELEEENVVFEDAKAKMQFTVPVELAITEDEWSRAVGEILAKKIFESAGT